MNIKKSYGGINFHYGSIILRQCHVGHIQDNFIRVYSVLLKVVRKCKCYVIFIPSTELYAGLSARNFLHCVEFIQAPVGASSPPK